TGPQAWKASFAKGKPSVTQRDGVTSKFGPTVGSGLGKPKAAYGMPAKVYFTQPDHHLSSHTNCHYYLNT
ncbi:hypothetical protein PoMZ_11324, partial [Pyricularia oryzae]